VGGGPFPTELGTEKQTAVESKGQALSDADKKKVAAGDEYTIGKFLRTQGVEFGTTTGRPRRCGWLDTVVVRYAHRINHFDELAVTKLDVLAGLPTLMIADSYTLHGKEIHEFPADLDNLSACKPVYIEMEGFEEIDHAAVRANGQKGLPKNALAYLKKIQELVGVPITVVGVGPGREETLTVKL
jgi:adenylosuccinate synthase